MNNYLISPEDCLIVRTLKEAQSLREAARVLNCDPAGLLRKVHRIAKDHDLLVKTKGRWVITKKGMHISNWVEETLLSQKKAINSKSVLKIGTTTWYSEQLVMPGLAQFKKTFPKIGEVHVLTPQKVENALLNHEIDFGINCYIPNDPQIAHKKILKEKWVIIAPSSWRPTLKSLNQKETLQFLSKNIFVRHHELNLNQVFPQMVSSIEHQLVVDHLIGVRAALVNGLGWSCVPELLIKSEQFSESIVKLDIESSIQHEICISWLRNRKDAKDLSMKLASWLIDECHQ